MPAGLEKPRNKVKREFDAVVFDAYGTLFDVDSVTAECERAYPGQGKAVSSVWRRKQLEYTWQLSLMERYKDFESVTRDALRTTLEEMSLSVAPGSAERLMAEYLRLRPFPDVKETLTELRSSVRLAVLSNGTRRMLNEVISQAGLSPEFEAIISAERAHTYKPHPSVYNLVVTDMGVPNRQRVLFVSANRWDVAGSKSFGFRAVWINRTHAGSSEWREYAPDYQMERLTGLVKLVNGD